MTNFFAANRERLLKKVSGNLVVMTSYASMQRSNDIAASFEQESNFWWLTGIETPGWWVIIDGIRNKSWIVAAVESSIQESAQVAALASSGVDGILTLDSGMHMLRELAKKHSIVRTLGEQPRSDYLNFSLNPAPRKMYDMLDRTFSTVQDCRRELAQLRAIKQPEELARIKKATNLTIAALEQVRSTLSERKYEYEIESELVHHFRTHGAKGSAYEVVVASGDNACNLEYTANNGKLKKRDLILIDAGARLQGYAAGIARTYCYGEPTKRQREIHKALQDARIQIIALLGPNLPIDKYQRDVDTIMQNMLVHLGLMADKHDTAAYRRYFPHAISHGVGVDAHDSLAKPHFFQPDMVLTVEPGVYIPEEGIGMRLADTIAITSSGITNLTARLSTDL